MPIIYPQAQATTWKVGRWLKVGWKREQRGRGDDVDFDVSDNDSTVAEMPVEGSAKRLIGIEWRSKTCQRRPKCPGPGLAHGIDLRRMAWAYLFHGTTTSHSSIVDL